MILINTSELSMDKVHADFQKLNFNKTLIIDLIGMVEVYRYCRFRGELDQNETISDALKQMINNKKIFNLIDNIILILNDSIKEEIVSLIEQYNKVIYKIEST